MADFKVVGKLVIDDKGQLKILGKKAKGASQQLDKVGTSAQTADRRLKGAAQASSGSSKNFSKMAQGINGGLVPAYATLAASLFAIGALFRGLEEAANIKNQTKGMEIFGNATGIAMKGIVSDLRAATGGMLDFRNAAQQAQIATAAGFSGEQIIQLGKGAKLASVALGRDLTDSFNRLLRGVTKAEPELLDELGIILRIDDATRKYAQANDLVASKLTISQRRAAVFEEVSRQLGNNFSAFEDGADGALNSFSRLQVAFSDIIKGLTAFIGPLEYVAEFLAVNTGAAATIFLGFAVSITKSAFPALKNITAALDGYAVKSKLAADASIANFRKAALAFKGNAADIVATDKLRLAKTQAILKKLGAAERFNNMQSVTSKKKSLQLLINYETARVAAVKKLTSGELAHIVGVHRAIEASSLKMTTRLITGTKAVASGISAGIILPATLAQGALAGVGKIATRLGPVFAGLGAIINAAFFIFTAGFIIKFLYDLLFVTKEEKEERIKIKAILDASAEKLQEINRISKGIGEEFASGAINNIGKLNKSLLQTYNLINGLGGDTMVATYREKVSYGGRGGTTTSEKLNSEEAATLSGQIISQLTALDGLNKLTPDLINSFKSLSSPGGAMADFNAFVTRATAAQFGGFSDSDIEDLDKYLSGILTKDFKGDALLKVLQKLNNASKKTAAKGEGLYNVNEAAKEVKDTLATIGDGYKPTAFDTLNKQLKNLKVNLDEARKAGDKPGYYKVIEDKLGLSEGALGSNDNASEFVNARVLAAAKIIKDQKDVLDTRSNLAAGIASYGSRKNELATFAKEKLREKDYTEQIKALETEKLKEQELLILRQRQGEEIDERKLNNLTRQLDVLKAQSAEYTRANSVAGKLQDTFADGLDNMFQSIIDGTSKAKDALKQLAVVVIQELQRIVAARMAAGMIASLTDVFPGFGGGTPETPKTSSGGFKKVARYGGTFGKKGYASGGIADGPASGYNVLMHGREAIVPLPNGDKIPVQLTGKGQGPVNSVINVTVNNEGDTETSAEESTALGEAIQMAVTREISEQQRPGGLLSPI